MRVLNVRNVQQALPMGIELLMREGQERQTRNGSAVVAPTPVTTVYQQPCERVLFWPVRDANPFFHLMEALWMLAGRNDVTFVAQYAKQMKEYSDNGKTFHGAYGFRWRRHFARVNTAEVQDWPQDDELDQVAIIIKRLRKDPSDRRCVLAMWDANVDLGGSGKDYPCNLNACFQVGHDGRLHMTVFNRSNDIIWGAYGANAVHFSILLEYIASGVGVHVGTFTQVSNNYHAYTEKLKPLVELADAIDPVRQTPHYDPYRADAKPYPLVSTSLTSWDRDLELFFDDPTSNGFNDPFFTKIVKPMYWAHVAYKKNTGTEKYDEPMKLLKQMPEENDWRRAAMGWLLRRCNKARTVADGGSHHALQV